MLVQYFLSKWTFYRCSYTRARSSGLRVQNKITMLEFAVNNSRDPNASIYMKLVIPALVFVTNDPFAIACLQLENTNANICTEFSCRRASICS
jgi:hypothetical protein